MNERDSRLKELKDMLLAKDYKPKLIDAAIEKALAVPWEEAIKRVVKNKNTDRKVFAVKYDPRLPSIPGILHKHYCTMVQDDPYLKSVFPKPFLVAYKRAQNLREKLIHSKVPPAQPSRPRRELKGMHKCNKPRYITDKYVKEGKSVKIATTKEVVEINANVNCADDNVIYVISCKQCSFQYVGKSVRKFTTRMGEHRAYVINKNLDEATGEHFNLRNHNLSHMSYTILEKVHNTDPIYLRERERKNVDKEI